MGLIASTVKSLISKIAIFAALAVLMSTTLAETAAIQHIRMHDGLWETGHPSYGVGAYSATSGS